MNELKYEKELEQLRHDHRKLDDQISGLESLPFYDEMELRRLKKEKVKMKDRMVYLESILFPDIIA